MEETTLEAALEVIIDVPRGSFVKLDDAGRVDYVSPLPCPFNYGSVPGTHADDGDRLDVLVLGPRLARGTRLRLPVVGLVKFVDAGLSDPKYVCASVPLRGRDRLLIRAFFTLFARAKRLLNRLRGARGATEFRGLVERDAMVSP